MSTVESSAPTWTAVVMVIMLMPMLVLMLVLTVVQTYLLICISC